MSNKYQAVMAFIDTCPLVGRNLYFNSIDETNNDNNTTLIPVSEGLLVKKYVDGGRLLKMQFEIRQVKPFATYSNTTANTDQIQIVQNFLDWINEQGENNNFPDWGNTKILNMATPDEVKTPILVGVNEGSALYAFPFEILYYEE